MIIAKVLYAAYSIIYVEQWYRYGLFPGDVNSGSSNVCIETNIDMVDFNGQVLVDLTLTEEVFEHTKNMFMSVLEDNHREKIYSKIYKLLY